MTFLHCLLIGSLLPVMCSCVREVAMDAMEEPQVAVECILCDEPVQTLKLNYTKGASQEKAEDLPEAEAVLTDLTAGKEAGRFSRSANGVWRLEYAAIPLHDYRLDVTIPGHEPISAEQRMPDAPEIDAVWDSWRYNLPQDEKYREEQGYIFSADTLTFPVWFYGMNYPDPSSNGRITELLCTDYPEVDKFNEVTYSIGTSLWDCFFRTSAYPDLAYAPQHRHYLRFPERAAEKTEFIINGDFEGYMENPGDFVNCVKRFPELHYFSASDDYDRYLADCYHLEQLSSSSDLSSIFLRDNLYSNVQGAMGIFGAKVERTLLWDDDKHWGEDGPFSIAPLVPYRRILKGKIGDHYDYIAWRGDKSPDEFAENRHQVPLENAHWLSHKPFSLLHFEARVGIPEDWKYGVKLDPVEEYGYYQYIKHAIYRIDDAEQLEEHGLGRCSQVDFSRKTVLVLYIRDCYSYLPYILDYWVDYNTGTGASTYVFYAVNMCDSWYYYSGEVINADISCKLAIVVDKIDEDAETGARIQFAWDRVQSTWWEKDDGKNLLEDIVLPQMGVVGYHQMVK